MYYRTLWINQNDFSLEWTENAISKREFSVLFKTLLDNEDEGDETHEINIECKIKSKGFILKASVIIRDVEQTKNVQPFLVQKFQRPPTSFHICYNIYGKSNSLIDFLQQDYRLKINGKILRRHFLSNVNIILDNISSSITTKTYKLLNGEDKNWESFTVHQKIKTKNIIININENLLTFDLKLSNTSKLFLKVSRIYHKTLGFYLSIYIDNNLELRSGSKGLFNDLRKYKIGLTDQRIYVRNRFVPSRYERIIENNCYLMNIDDILKESIFKYFL